MYTRSFSVGCWGLKGADVILNKKLFSVNHQLVFTKNSELLWEKSSLGFVWVPLPLRIAEVIYKKKPPFNVDV